MDATTIEFQLWMDFAKKTFEHADERSSLDKAKDEIHELQMEFQMSEGENTKARELEEYVDIIMCILHSAGCRGFYAETIINAFKIKHNINMRREWKQNSNRTYSHKK